MYKHYIKIIYLIITIVLPAVASARRVKNIPVLHFVSGRIEQTAS